LFLFILLITFTIIHGYSNYPQELLIQTTNFHAAIIVKSANVDMVVETLISNTIDLVFKSVKPFTPSQES
jgi:hypothetical protein